MKATTTMEMIEVLQGLFAWAGLPEQMVSDNGPQFILEEFKSFTCNNGIHHITSVPYHLATNGLVERFVQTLQTSLEIHGS